MDKEFVHHFIGLKVKIDIDVGTGSEYYFYEGFIKDISNDTLLFEDRFGRLVSILISTIVRIEEVKNNNKEVNR
jgi:hypothetical protein